jgi:cardiolipin synthase
LAADAGAALAVMALLLGVIALLGIAIWSIKRHRDPKLALDTDAPLDELIPSLSGIALGMPIEGNAVEVFENGAFFDALLKDIAAATRSVHFETFLWKKGALGQRMADAFSERSRAGVQVRLVLDASGCRTMGKAVRQQMRDAGCRLALYHPRTLRNIGVVLERDHRKIAVLDGRIAWVGGPLHRRRMARRGPPTCGWCSTPRTAIFRSCSIPVCASSSTAERFCTRRS